MILRVKGNRFLRWILRMGKKGFCLKYRQYNARRGRLFKNCRGGEDYTYKSIISTEVIGF